MAWEEQFDREAKAAFPGVRVLAEEPMCRYTSFRIGGPARRMAFPANGGELAAVLSAGQACGAEILILGSGTNLISPDEGLDRLVICTRGMSGVAEGDAAGTLIAEAGCSLRRLAEAACERGLAGLAFAHGIPGSTGGGVCMNAGAYGGEMVQVLEGAEILFPGEGVRFLPVEELRLGYRHSLLTERPELVVLRARVRLSEGDPAEIRAEMRDLAARRKASQPLEYPSAGSTFKRPPGNYTGTLIDRCGLKGLTVGGAQVSEKHAGFLINRGGATFRDVTALIQEVQERVREQTGILLEPEVRIIR